MKKYGVKVGKYTNKEEYRVVNGSEHKTALALGEIKIGETTRHDHYGTFFPTYNPKTTEVGAPDIDIFNKK